MQHSAGEQQGRTKITLEQLISLTLEGDMDLLERHALGGSAPSEENYIAPAQERLIGVHNFYTNKNNTPSRLLTKDLSRGIAIYMAYSSEEMERDQTICRDYYKKSMYWMLGGTGAGLTIGSLAGLPWGVGSMIACMAVASYYGAKGNKAAMHFIHHKLENDCTEWQTKLDLVPPASFDIALENLREHYQPILSLFLSKEGPLNDR